MSSFWTAKWNFTDQTKNEPHTCEERKKTKNCSILGKGGITLAAQGEAKKNTKKFCWHQNSLMPTEFVKLPI
jgi:hypothetical protein